MSLLESVIEERQIVLLNFRGRWSRKLGQQIGFDAGGNEHIASKIRWRSPMRRCSTGSQGLGVAQAISYRPARSKILDCGLWSKNGFAGAVSYNDMNGRTPI
jgi:hypothetical protein